MLKNFLFPSDELKMARRIADAYIERSGLDPAGIEDMEDGGDWLGMGDRIKIAEVRDFNRDTGNFLLKFVTTDVDNKAAIKSAIMKIEIINDAYQISCGDSFVRVVNCDDPSVLYPAIDLAINNSTSVK